MLKRGVALLLLLCMALPCAATAEQADARRVVYLTFDDGPKKDTPELLDALEALDVPATFFLVGLGVRAFPEYARRSSRGFRPICSAFPAGARATRRASRRRCGTRATPGLTGTR